MIIMTMTMMMMMMTWLMGTWTQALPRSPLPPSRPCLLVCNCPLFPAVKSLGGVYSVRPRLMDARWTAPDERAAADGQRRQI
jgi:hypothetical protein